MAVLPPPADAARVSRFLTDQPVPRPQAATVDKLRMPFRLLADPGGRQAIRPYRGLARGQPVRPPGRDHRGARRPR